MTRRFFYEGRHAPPLPAGVNPAGPLPTRGRLRRLAGSIVVVLSVGALTACADDLPKATEIARMRILGAQLSVEGDETRTTPKPRETVHMSLSTQFPSLAADRAAVRSLIITCTAPDRFTGGIPICQELIDVASAPGASAGDIELPEGFDQRLECADLSFASPVFPPSPLSAHCKMGEPVFDIAIPEGYTADEVMFAGIVCEHGKAVLDPELPGLFGCEDDDAEPIPLHGLIRVQHGGEDENHNPDMSALRLVREISGLWQPIEASALTTEIEARCESFVERTPDPELPWAIGGLTLNIGYEAGARELASGEPEELELTIYATSGELERRFTLFGPEQNGRKILDADGNPLIDDDGNVLRQLHDSIHWDSPKVADLPDDGELVRFFVTIRDGRGGFGQADYALCALKQEP